MIFASDIKEFVYSTSLPENLKLKLFSYKVAGMSDAVAKLLADENLLETHIDHVLAAPVTP